MISILITGDMVYTGEEALKNGYVYVKGGRIISIGEGSPPDEYTYATLILGGPGRIILPGLSIVAEPIMYPFRYISLVDKCRLYETIDEASAFKIALAGIYELNRIGATRIVVKYPERSLANSLREALGGVFEPLTYSCQEKKDDLRTIIDPRRDIHNLESVFEYSSEVSKTYNLGTTVLREGETANIAVFNARRPPLFFVTKHSSLDPDQIFKSGSSVESLLYGDNIIVDSEEHLLIVEKHLREAYDVAESLISRLVADRGLHHPNN